MSHIENRREAERGAPPLGAIECRRWLMSSIWLLRCEGGLWLPCEDIAVLRVLPHAERR
jgi:hypothetical protein